MRVALIAPLVTPITEPQLGGSQALLADIATGLALRGHDVAVFAASGSEIDGVRVVDTGVDPDALRSTLFRVDAAVDGDGPSAAAFARVYELTHAESWDVVHNHAFDEPAVSLAPRDVPVVHTLHLPPRRAIADAIAEARVRSRSLAIAAVSRWGAASWEPLVHVDLVLPNGVPVDRIPFSDDPGRGVLYAGRLSPEKGAAEAIEIAQRAGKTIVVVGDPYDADYAAARIEPHRGSDDVEIRPAVPREELWQLMGSSRAVLCPAMWDEPFGLVAAEAQASGTPVIAFARGALGEVIRDGETGALVADVDEAVAALGDVGRFERTTCRDHAERSLSLDRTLDAHEALYARLAAPTIART